MLENSEYLEGFKFTCQERRSKDLSQDVWRLNTPGISKAAELRIVLRSLVVERFHYLR